MKKLIILLLTIAMACTLLACSGVTGCKECGDEVYQDGYCKYHYTLNSAKDNVDNAAKGVFDAIFGD